LLFIINYSLLIILVPFSITLKLAIKALLVNKTRSFLSILGIVIGISSVIILMAAGVGAQNFILDTVQSFGSNLVQIMPGTPDDESYGFSPTLAGITITTLKYEDAQKLKDNPQAPNIANTTATISSQIVATSSYNEKLTQFFGTTPSYFSIRNTEITSGRMFEAREVDSLARVAILAPDVAKDLFPNTDPIGENIKIDNITFKIIGITESKGIGQLGVNFDDLIYIPVTTGQKLLLGIDYVSNIIIAADSDNNTSLAAEQAKLILRDLHHIDEGEKSDFTVMNSQDALETINAITDAMASFLAAIAAISLLVGGIGIMNIMLVSVTERTKEIGLRKAIGAKRTDILSQFITESVIITLIGGIIGILIGLGISTAITQFTTLRTAVTLDSILLATGVSTLAGIVFGFYPANQASKLNPIEALRFQ
ncbi:ABC transporter permease, partial [Patescibacteria group bacterium]|nr:ABC transporter permease [Patescibacteria group bacterium]